MPQSILTPKQKKLIKELEEINSLLSLDYQNILQYHKNWRTPHLEVIKQQLIRGQIITWYTLADEFLSMELCYYFFGEKKSFIYLWRTKKFQNFNHFIIEELYLIKKLQFVKKIKNIPSSISENIERLNWLRNGLAHSFFPDNLKKSKPIYKGKHVFTLEGLRLLKQDFDKMFELFIKKSILTHLEKPRRKTKNHSNKPLLGKVM
jgi:hypothetical protein